ncbi:hypothetical protein Tco_0808259 [Tanacetum coccineum]
MYLIASIHRLCPSGTRYSGLLLHQKGSASMEWHSAVYKHVDSGSYVELGHGRAIHSAREYMISSSWSTVVANSVTLLLTPSKVVGCNSWMAPIRSALAVVGPTCLAALAAELSPTSYPGPGVVRHGLLRSGKQNLMSISVSMNRDGIVHLSVYPSSSRSQRSLNICRAIGVVMMVEVMAERVSEEVVMSMEREVMVVE